MATTRGKQISANISNLKAELNLLRAELDKLVKQGASFEEINKKLGVTYENLTNKIAASEAALIKYANANKGNVKRNEELSKSVQKLTQQSDSLRASFNNVASVVQTSVNEAISRNTVIVKKNETAVEQQANSYKNLKAQIGGYFKGILQQNKVDTNAANVKERLAAQTERSSKATTTFGQAFRTAFSPKAWGSAIANVLKFVGLYQILYGAIEAVREITIGSIKTFIDFEDSIGRLRAVSGASADETKLLSDSIRETAVVTRFTATQVTELATSLAKLGADARDIPGLILPVSLAAQALGADLDAVGETLLKVRNQFGLSTAETVTSANTLIAAVNRSALSLDSFNTAIQYIGPIASQAGLSFSETSAYLEVLADNGFSASRIGTGLRGIFIDLKEAGVPLVDTLQELADENISVAQATELVGKRAAAQLITLVDNIRELRRATDENDQYAESLKASAAQMSTTAGQLDILKSAYEELRISIGDAIADSEFFLNLIGLLSEDSENLARGYKALDNVFKSEIGFETVSSNVESLAKGVVNAETSILSAYSTLAATGQAPQLVEAFNAITNAGIELNGELLGPEGILSILSSGNTWTEISKYAKGTRDVFGELTDGLGLPREEVVKLQAAINSLDIETPTEFFKELGKQAQATQGLGGIFESQALAIQQSTQAGEERIRIEKLYEDQIKRIQNLGPQTIAGLEEIRKAQKEVSDEIQKTQDELEVERSKGLLANKTLINELEGRISGYRNVKKELADLGQINEEDDKEAEKRRKAQLKLDKDAIELRRAEIKEEIRQIKKIRDERIKEIEDRLEREKKAASTIEEAREAEQRAAKDIQDANKDAQDALDVTTQKTNKLIDDTTDLQIKYKKDFPDAFSTFSLSFEKILFDIQEAIRSNTLSPSELADSLLGQADTLFVEYEQNLAELKNTLGDSAQGQLQFAEASKQQFEVLKGELDKLLQTYYTYKASLTLLLGEDAANEILAPFEQTVTIIQDKVNKTGQAAAKTSEEIAKKTKEDIQSILVDGLGDALDAAIKALDKFNQVAFENTKDRIDREKEQVESRYELESDILKSQLDNQLITEEEYRSRQEKLRRKQLGEENTLDKSLFDAQQKRDRQSATSDYLQALASIVPNLIITDKDANPATIALKSAITAGIATASYGAELAAISQRKFVPKKFAEGGFVDGPSHSEGGVPFTVQGRGGYEMEGGEFIVNKRAAQLHRTILERINNSTRIVPQQGKMMFETGGVVSTQTINPATLASQQGSVQATVAQLDYLRAIAETNVTISQNTSKPVRAYVSSSDLQTNATERKIKERNTQV